ncbi:MAG: hypothetical protein ACP5NS_03265 [Candidatus Pacearchaeota archaeon]
MIGLFLQDLPLAGSDLAVGIAAFIFAFLFFFVVILIAGYVYLSLAYSAIARKARLKSPGIAWIPGLGPLIIAYQSSRMHWWPWLLLIGYLIPFVNIFVGILFTIFAIIWSWKMFERVGKPGWWAILMIIPIVNLVIIGIAAWSKK